MCPFCESNRSFCECQSVANDPRLSAEWHPDNPPPSHVAARSSKKYLWKCPNCHPAYEARCDSRATQNTKCPVCAQEGREKHPSLSNGRPELAEEWDAERNNMSPDEVTLGSDYRAWWICSSNPEHPPFKQEVSKRALRGQGCPKCRNRFRPREYGSRQAE